MSEQSITVIVAIIAAIAAIAAPVVAQLITRREAYRLKELELFFAEKAKVYREYLEVTSQFTSSPTLEEMQRLNNALNQAIVYSSEDTMIKLNKYMYLLKNTKSTDYDAIADAHCEATKAIHDELAKYEHSKKKKHHLF